MSAIPDDLSTLKDDMIAFVEGHGMRRFLGFVNLEETQCIMWDGDDNPDAWKDFVELAKASGAPFLTMHAWLLNREELDELVKRLGTAQFTSDDDVEDARWLRTYIGKIGFLQLGWPYQGSVMLYEVGTLWYERYQRLVEISEDFGGMAIDESDDEGER
jgi:hypothetical protein